MAFMNKDRKAVIKKNLQPVLDTYQVKGSLSISSNSCIVLTLTSGNVDFVGDMNDFYMGKEVDKFKFRCGGSFDVNMYWWHELFQTGSKSWYFIRDAIVELKSAAWYNRSDASIDYFDTAYYIEIQVGKRGPKCNRYVLGKWTARGSEVVDEFMKEKSLQSIF